MHPHKLNQFICRIKGHIRCGYSKHFPGKCYLNPVCTKGATNYKHCKRCGAYMCLSTLMDEIRARSQ